MAKGPQISKHDRERAMKVMEYEERTEPKFKRPSTAGSCLMLLIALAIAGAIAYYVITHKETFVKLWNRAIHPDSVQVQPQTDQ